MALINNWKTTVSGLAAALGVYFTSLDAEPFLKSIGSILSILGPIFMGWFAMDAVKSRTAASVPPTIE